MKEKMIAKLEVKGFKRWTKGNMDRLYINAEYLGYEPETASAAAKLNGEYISKSEARRITNAKIYIDLKDDTLHSDGYWNNNLKDAAQALIDEATAEIESEEEKKLWYAVLTDNEDSDWGTGFYEFELARKLMIEWLDRYPEAHIAVIDEGDRTPMSKICVKEIRPEDLDEPFNCAARIVKAHDWDACKEDLDDLMKYVGLKDEWRLADGDNFENVIVKAGARIGIAFK